MADRLRRDGNRDPKVLDDALRLLGWSPERINATTMNEISRELAKYHEDHARKTTVRALAPVSVREVRLLPDEDEYAIPPTEIHHQQRRPRPSVLWSHESVVQTESKSQHPKGAENPPVIARSSSETDLLLPILADIETEFGSCSSLLTQPIEQVRLIHSPAQSETLNKYFSTEERNKIHQSIGANAKDAYWDLYRVLLHVYNARVDLVQKVTNHLSLAEQQFFASRHKALFNLINRYKDATSGSGKTATATAAVAETQRN